MLASYCGDDLRKTDLLRDLSFEYRDIDPQKCKEYARQALDLAQSVGSKLKEGSAHNALGIYYYFVDKHYQAYVHYKQAEKLLIENGDPKELKEIFYNLMNIFIFVHDGDSATYYANKLLDMAVAEGDMPSEITARYALGQIRFENYYGQQEELDYYLDLFRKAARVDDNITYIVALCCAEAYVEMKRYREGLSYLHRARQYFEAHEETGYVMEACLRLAEAYTSMSQVDSAELYMQKVLTSPVLYENVKLRLFENRAMLDSIKGDCWSALANYKVFHHLADSIAWQKSSNEMIGRINWYNTKNENQMLQQEKQKNHQMIYFLTVTLMVILILVALLAYYYWLKKKKNKELKELHHVKDKLFSVVAHDLRSPIGALMSMLRLVNENMLDANSQAELLKGISNRVDDTYGLLDNLLHWSKSQMQGIVPSPVYFDVQASSQSVTNSLQGIAAEKHIRLDNRIKQQQAYADKDMFAVVVRNLTMNALKYTFKEGEVTLESELSGNELVISVKDNGTGMTQDVQDKLFGLSKTASKRGTNNENGTGLGLVLCADFVKTNGGRIWFESKPAQGSIFFFSLPVHPDTKPQTAI
jgi:signal transduction histidine kinase